MVPNNIHEENGRGIIYKIKFSRCYIIYSLAAVVLSFILVTSMLIQPQDKPFPLSVVILDGILTFLICVEIGTDMFVKKRQAASSSSMANIFDLVVAFLCLTGLVFMILELGGYARYDETLGVLLLGIRYSTQLFRAVRFVSAYRSASDQRSAVENDGCLIRFPTHYHSAMENAGNAGGYLALGAQTVVANLENGDRQNGFLKGVSTSASIPPTKTGR